MAEKIVVLIASLLTISCTSISYSEKDIQKEFGSSTFSLASDMYLYFDYDCTLLRGIRESETPTFYFKGEVSKADLDYFKKYEHVDIGDRHCTLNEDVRVYQLLESGTKVNITSIKDRADASWWRWVIEGNITIKEKSRNFLLEIPYRKSRDIHQELKPILIPQVKLIE